MSEAPMTMWLTGPLSAEVRKALARIARAPDVERVAVMPDVHLATGVCVGVAVATRRLIYPQAVGSDIGCGMATVPFDCEAEAIDSEEVAPNILSALREAVPIMRHRSLAATPELPCGLGELSAPTLLAAARREGRIELGTLGRGNHFLEFQRDQDDRLWLMVHSGSRIMGQEITRYHSAKAVRAGSGLVHLDAGMEAGQAYLNDAAWAVRFAAASRALMIERAAEVVARIVGAKPDPATFFDASHNHLRPESYPDGNFFVHRKGASPAASDEEGLIPGSMGAPSYHVRGRGVNSALRSSSHGAGRVLSRTEARRGISVRRLGEQVGGLWLDRKRLGGLTEEAPGAYKDIRAVMRAQRELVRIEREVVPVLNYKGA
jgi:tRNA-splicing ligase RtcB (3'-phosphate/5'-hydroxy nucleic acid ligase)